MRTLEINTIVTLNNWSLVNADYNESNRFQYNQHLIARTGYYYLAVEITKQGIELINLVGLNATKYGRVQTLSSANDIQTTPKLYKTVNGNEDKFRLNIDVPGQRIKEELVVAKTIYKVKVFATQIITTNGVWSSINESNFHLATNAKFEYNQNGLSDLNITSTGNWGLWNNFTPKFKKSIPVWFPETLCDFHREMTDGKMNGNDPIGSAHWQFGPIAWAFNSRIVQFNRIK